jgi:hypothetical protein
MGGNLCYVWNVFISYIVWMYICYCTLRSVKPLFHLRSDPTAQPFNISFSPNPTSCHHCPYTTIWADINITRPSPTPKTSQTEDILNTITANADNNLQHHERGKLGCSHKPSTPTTPFIHGDDVIGKLYKKTWSSSPSPLTPGHNSDLCYKHSSPPPTIPVRNPGAPHTPTLNITSPMPTSCTNKPPNHHAHLVSSHQPNYVGVNPPHPHSKHSLGTHTLRPHQVYIHFNSLDSAFQKHLAHYYEMLPVRSNFLPPPLHLTYFFIGETNTQYRLVWAMLKTDASP